MTTGLYRVCIIVRDDRGRYYSMTCRHHEWDVYPLRPGYSVKKLRIFGIDDLLISDIDGLEASFQWSPIKAKPLTKWEMIKAIFSW